MSDWRKKRVIYQKRNVKEGVISLAQQQLGEDFAQDKYFDEDEVHADKRESSKHAQKEEEEEEEEDELDAYMKQMEAQAEQDIKETLNKKNNVDPAGVNQKRKAGERLDEDDDPLDSYLNSIKKKLIKEADKKNSNKGTSKKTKGDDNEDDSGEADEEEDDNQYEFLDSDGEVDFSKVKDMKKKNFQLLDQVDHSSQKYDIFTKNFYLEHPDISKLTPQQIEKIRKEYEIKVSGVRPPNPIVSFGHLGFDEELMNLIVKQGFQKPTQIQAQNDKFRKLKSLPCGLSGRDIVGVAKTGSGKTVAYLWPLLIHILDQREVEKNEGPIGLILAPTRELCQQVYMEAKRYAKIYNISVGALLGGENKHEQWKMLKGGVEILVATPGRLMEMIQKKATNLRRCTYVVIDEADKMFSMGFEKQIRSIMQQIRPDRQTLLFTATLKKKIQNLVMDVLTNPITINIGGENQANEDIRQEPIILRDVQQKDQWLLNNLIPCLQKGKVLIFVNHIANCNKLHALLYSTLHIDSLILHGDRIQSERTDIINKFKTTHPLLIATDVASRGLDIPEIKTVINYDIPTESDTYIHRIGRTGRAGATDGTAYSLILMNDSNFAVNMLRVMEISGQPIPNQLEEIAMNDEKFKSQRLATKLGVDFAKGKDSSKLLKQALSRQRNTRHGLGFKEDEGLSLKDKIKSDAQMESKRQSQAATGIQMTMPGLQMTVPCLNINVNELAQQIGVLQMEEKQLVEERDKIIQQQAFIRDYQEQLWKSGKITYEQYIVLLHQQQSQTAEKDTIISQIRGQLQLMNAQIARAQPQLMNNQNNMLTNPIPPQSSSVQQPAQQNKQQVASELPLRQSRETIMDNFQQQMKRGMQQQFRSSFVSGGVLQKKN